MEVSEYNKQYRLNHLEEAIERSNRNRVVPFTCMCGANITKGSKPTHLRTKNHMEKMHKMDAEQIY